MAQTKIFPTILKVWKVGEDFHSCYVPLLVTHFECKLLNMLKLVNMFAEVGFQTCVVYLKCGLTRDTYN